MAQVDSVAPAVREKICCSNMKNCPLALPCVVVGNINGAAVPPHFISSRRPMVTASDLERVAKNPRRKIVVIPSCFTFPPCRQGFPAKRDDDLLAPFQ